ETATLCGFGRGEAGLRTHGGCFPLPQQEESMTRWTRGRVALAALLVAFLSGLALAQELTTGIIEGVVKDDKGNPIAPASVSRPGKQGTRTVTTDSEGRFTIRSLPAGSYTVKAEAQGFGAVVQSDVNVNLGKRTQVPFKLSTGRVETVT